jgi:hypothetical protein
MMVRLSAESNFLHSAIALPAPSKPILGSVEPYREMRAISAYGFGPS